jgi:outer membrane protein OmpA-like peptidoglycan-associated protein/opacity protein-like surface antigen
MKKGLLLFCASMLLAGSSVFAQKYSHWSLDVKGGVDRGEWGHELKNGYYGFEVGGEVEYTFNPLFGLALDYAYIDYGREVEGADDFTGSTHEISLIGSVNALNLVAKYRTGNWQKLNIYARGGAGVSIYSTDLTDQSTLVIPMSAALEYDLGKHIAIGLTGERRWHTSSDMGLGYMGVPRASMWSALASVRWKIAANKNTHIRNVSLVEYEAPLAGNLVEKYDDSELKQAVNNNAAAIAQLQDQLGKTNSDVNRINGDLTKAKEDIEKCCSQPAPLPTMDAYPSLGNIQFAVNSQVIAPNYQRELDALAEQLKKQQDLKVTVTGYTDSSGNVKSNEALSLKRAETVSNYLVSKGVPSAQIITRGMGPANPIASNATAAGRVKNRRVEVLFSR